MIILQISSRFLEFSPTVDNLNPCFFSSNSDVGIAFQKTFSENIERIQEQHAAVTPNLNWWYD